jgi:hypothetical protein
MSAGSVLAAAALLLLAAATGPVAYYLAWALIGLAGTTVLTTPAQVALAAIAGDKARPALGVLMLVAGLSSTLFWPIASGLEHAIGWRSTVVLFALLHLCVCAPLHLGLTRGGSPTPGETMPAPTADNRLTRRTTFGMVAGAISLNGFISWGFALTLIALFEARGIGRAEAVTAASLMGVVAVSARALDFVGGVRWNGLTSALVAGAALPAGLCVLLVGEGSLAIGIFVLLYGASTGVLAVARATLPLVFFPGAAYARASARLALPLNLAFAAAPPFFGTILSRYGPDPALWIALAASLAALLILVLLERRSRNAIPVGTQAGAER